MDSTPKIITIIGLVLEFFNGVGLFFAALLLTKIMDREFFLQLEPNIPIDELDMVMDLYSTIGSILYILAGILLVVFLINVFIFGKLILGKYSEETAKKVYTYQFIWGILNIFMNILVGILYIISGNQGKKGLVEMRDTREGI